MRDLPYSLLNLDADFDYRCLRSAMTGMSIPPERPPAVLDPVKEIPEYEQGLQFIAEARARLESLQADREQAKLKIVGTEEARAALVQKVARGEKISQGSAEKVLIERQGYEAALEVIEKAVAVAAEDVEKARGWFRRVCRHATAEVIQILVRESNELDAEIRKLRTRSETLAAWANELQVGLNGNPTESDLQRLLGIK